MKNKNTNSNAVPRFEAALEYTPHLYRTIVHLQMQQGGAWLRYLYAGLGAVCLLIAVVLLFLNMSNIFTVFPFVVAFALVGAFALSSGLNMEKVLAKKMWKNHRRSLAKVRYAFYDTCVKQVEPKQENDTLEYTAFSRLVETQDYFLLYTSDTALNAVNKHYFEKEQRIAFRTFVEEACGKKFEKQKISFS